MEVKFNANEINGADECGNITANIDISTKEAVGALASNAKAKLKNGWQWVKPKLKVIAGVGAIMGAGAYIYSEMVSKPVAAELEKSEDGDYVDVDGEFEVYDDQADLDDGQQDNLDNDQNVEEG